MKRVFLLVLLFLGCSTSTSPAAPCAPPPPPPVSDAGACEAACDAAQQRCDAPASVSSCVESCRLALENQSPPPTAECAALIATCNESCP